MPRRWFFLFPLLLLAPSVLTPSARAQIPQLSDEARVSMLTILPGDQVYSEFGHSAFRIHDPQRGIDRMYNYGTFRFDDPLFVLKFLYGQLDYFLSVVPYRAAYRHYAALERPIIAQQLRLTPAQRQALFRFLEINARPENRTYRYDFLYDNCSTRIRDALKKSLGEAVQFAGRPDPGKTFRHLLDPYVAERPALDVGFYLVLGMPADRVASPYQVMFLPVYLMRAFDHATIRTEAGREPLVTRTDTLLWVKGYQTIERSFPWPRWAAWALLLLGLGLTGYRGWNGHPPKRWPDAVLLGLVGLAGSIITFLWFLSEHAVTDQNWNLLWAWPTHLIAAVLLARGRSPRWLRGYLWAGVGAALLTALGWPWWPQDLAVAAFPLTLLLALRLGRQAWALRPADA